MKPSASRCLFFALLAGCSSQITSPDLALSTIAPQAICNDQITTEVTASGMGFTPLPVDTFTAAPHLQLPAVLVDLATRPDGSAGPDSDVLVPDDPQPPHNHVRWHSSTEMAFDVFPGLGDPGLYDVSIRNPDGRRTRLPASLVLVPPPTLSAVQPAPLCDAQGDVSFTLSGTGFIQLNGELPVVRFINTAAQGEVLELGASALTQCANPPAPMGLTLLSCKSLSVKLARGGLKPGIYQVAVRNPRETGCTTQQDVRIQVVPPPTLQQVTPVPVCDAQGDVSFTLSGTGFIQLGTALPSVTFTSATGMMAPFSVATPTPAGCTKVADPTVGSFSSCTGLQVTVPESSLAPDSYKVSVRNPQATGCATQEDVRAVVVPPPSIDPTMSPPTVCTAQADGTLVLKGSDFLTIMAADGTHGPQVDIGGKPFTSAATDCTPVPDAANAQECVTLSVSLPKASLTGGSYQLTVENPDPAACGLATPYTLQVVPPPNLSAVTPRSICAGGGSLTLTGTDLRPGITALIGSTASSGVTTSADFTSATATFKGPLTPTAVPQDVTVRNAGCQSTLAAQVTITPGPSILFVDPPVAPNNVSLQATVYATGITPAVKSIQIAPAGTMTYTSLTFTTDPAHPNRLYVIIPANLKAGSYDMVLTDSTAGNCPAVLPGAIKISATPTLMVNTLTPAFGSAGQNTAVVVTGTGFAAIPRVYLNPTGNPAGSVASALRAVTFQGTTSLSAVVPTGLTPGSYDAIVVNPDGSFGFATKAYTVTPANAPPPVITSIAPSSFVSAVATGATIYGSGFRSPALTLTCQDNAGNAVAGASASVTSSTSTTISAQLTTAGALCQVRVTDSDGTYFDYSAVGVTNASLKLGGFTSGSSLTTPRRAAGASAGRPTAVARFVYAIGGDGGSESTPLSSVEAAPTALDGTLGNFAPTSQALPAPRTFISVANIGRFLYAVGGFTGTAAAREVYRAELLSPLLAPQVSDIDVTFDKTNGLSPGTYIYRVSAVLGSADANNPGGETLSSDPFPVRLPALAQGKVDLTLTWTPIAGAAQYKIYRSPGANDPSGSERLLATVSAGAMPLLLVDSGTVTPKGDQPLPLGSTGAWRAISPLGTARLGAGVAAAQSPATPGQWFLYAAGGNGGTVAAPTPLASVEYLPITVDPVTGNQTYTTWTATSSLATARWQAPALAATSANNSLVPAGSAYLYVLGGSTSSLTTLSGAIEIAAVGADGKLGAFAGSGSVGVKLPAYGGVLVNNEVIAFGGFQAGSAATNSFFAKLSSATKVGNFDSLAGGNLGLPRALQATALESAFIYQIGGASAAPGTAQNTTEQTVW